LEPQAWGEGKDDLSFDLGKKKKEKKGEAAGAGPIGGDHMRRKEEGKFLDLLRFRHDIKKKEGKKSLPSSGQKVRKGRGFLSQVKGKREKKESSGKNEKHCPLLFGGKKKRGEEPTQMLRESRKGRGG